MIEITEVKAGDVVTLQDANKNVVMGQVSINAEGHMGITAFGHTITFAKPAWTGKLTVNPHIKVVGHAPKDLREPPRGSRGQEKA